LETLPLGLGKTMSRSSLYVSSKSLRLGFASPNWGCTRLLAAMAIIAFTSSSEADHVLASIITQKRFAGVYVCELVVKLLPQERVVF
jgi:hypothetical protein